MARRWGLQPRVRRTRRGDFQLRLPPEERRLLGTLPGQLRELLPTGDPALDRLFPPAYPADPAGQAEFEGMTRDDLVAAKLSSLQVLESTIEAHRLTEDELVAWLGAINDLRLVLGTRLDVTEEMYEEGLPPDDERMPSFALYSYLGWLEDQIVEALAGGLDPAGTAG